MLLIHWYLDNIWCIELLLSVYFVDIKLNREREYGKVESAADLRFLIKWNKVLMAKNTRMEA